MARCCIMHNGKEWNMREPIVNCGNLGESVLCGMVLVFDVQKPSKTTTLAAIWGEIAIKCHWLPTNFWIIYPGKVCNTYLIGFNVFFRVLNLFQGSLWVLGIWISAKVFYILKIKVIISMGLCKKDVTPLLMHLSYVFLALTHRY